jgi:predicted metal-dependent hydrolase
LRKKNERDSKLAAATTKAREERRKAVVAKKADWLKRGQTHFENHTKEAARQVSERRTVTNTKFPLINPNRPMPTETFSSQPRNKST